VKKYQSSPEWKGMLQRKHRKAMKRLRSVNIQRRPTNRASSSTTIEVPSNMSFIDSPEDMIFFFNYTEKCAHEHDRLFFDFSKVTKMTSDAIVVFVAHMDRIKRSGVTSTGNLPEDPSLQLKLHDSGFFRYVRLRGSETPQSINSVAISNLQTDLDKATVLDVAKWAITNCFGEDRIRDEALSNAVGQTITECMYNTVDHANLHKRKIQPWAVNAHFDSTTGRVCVSFVDLGLGILKTIRPALRQQIFRNLRILSHGDLLWQVFQQKVSSRTQQDMRGLGLPSIRQHFEAGYIKKVIAITNGGYVDFENGNRNLTRHFNGTLIYWELWPDTDATSNSQVS
jgi:hypothetical protein